MSLQEEIRALCGDAAFQRNIADVLYRLCSIDTSPNSDLHAMRENEQRIFQVIQEELERIDFPGSLIEKRSIPHSIEQHPAYTVPYYATRSDDKTTPFSAEVYAGRHNLLYLLEGPYRSEGVSTALNAHVDVISPYLEPRRSGDYIYGRGSADDKGNIAGVIGTIKILKTLADRKRVSLRNRVTVMFVIDEETGGNGSLALAVDRSLRQRYDSILVLECTGNRIHPANRGAVYIKAEARLNERPSGGDGRNASLVESFSSALLELKQEADRIRQESEHPLFPERPVHMCPGILGPFGKHPSSICGELESELHLVSPETSAGDLAKVLEEGLSRYVAHFGDKTKDKDPRTGEPKVQRHYDISKRADGSFSIRVLGTTGHLGALPENDPAIMKWAYIVQGLLERKLRGELSFHLSLPGSNTERLLVFEGAQGFVPTHAIGEVKDRMRAAFLRGIYSYLGRFQFPQSAIACKVSFNKLHNEAFASDVDSPSLQRAIRAAKETGTFEEGAALVGFNASCDARLFAREYPSLPVITCGAGQLGWAHSLEERISLSELYRMIEFSALFLLRETGSIF